MVAIVRPGAVRSSGGWTSGRTIAQTSGPSSASARPGFRSRSTPRRARSPAETSRRSGGAGSGRRTPSRSPGSPPARHGRGGDRRVGLVGAKAASNADGRRGSSRRRCRSAAAARARAPRPARCGPRARHGRGRRRAARRSRPRERFRRRPDGQVVSPGHPHGSAAARQGICREFLADSSSVSMASSSSRGAHRARRSAPRRRAPSTAPPSPRGPGGRRARVRGTPPAPRQARARPDAASALHPAVCPDHRPASVGLRAQVVEGLGEHVREGLLRGRRRRAERRAAAARGQPPRGERKGGERADRQHRPERKLRLVRRGRGAVRAARSGVASERRWPKSALDAPAQHRTASPRSPRPTSSVISDRACSAACARRRPARGDRRPTPSRRPAPSRAPSRRRRG